jgi:hypothetical protein
MMLDRDEPLAALLRALDASLPVEIVGAPGVGKTVVLRHLCWRNEIAGLGGVVFKEHRNNPVEDLLQFLFESIYDADPGFKPTPGRLRRYLQDVSAVVVVDDLSLDQRDLETLRNSIPGCTFVSASEEARLLEGDMIVLAGLPEDAALSLFEGRLGRRLPSDERDAATSVIRSVNGNPRLIQQASSLLRTGAADLADLARRISTEGARELARASLSQLTSDERNVVETLSLLGGTPVAASRLEDLCGMPVAALLRPLLERGFVDARSRTYTLAGNVSEALEGEPRHAPRTTPVVDAVLDWMERDGGITSLDDVPLVVAAINWAGDAGRWREVFRLCRGVETTLLTSRTWGRWRWVLDRAAAAGWHLGDPVARGWALHQLGTLALCYEDYGQARELLERALSERRTAKDKEGAARTRHNLDVLRQLTGVGGAGGAPGGLIRRMWWTGLLVVVLVVAFFAWSHFAPPSAPQQAVSPSTLQTVLTPTPTPAPTPVPPPTPIQTPAPTRIETPPPAPPQLTVPGPQVTVTVTPYRLGMSYVWTRKPGGTEQSDFNCGDAIEYAFRVSSNAPGSVSATADLQSSGPGGTLLTHSKRVQIGPGESTFYHAATIPSRIAPGRYRFDVTVSTSEGPQTSGYYLFNVSCGTAG